MKKLSLKQMLCGIGILLMSFALLVGCKSLIKSSDSYISEQQAIDAALKIGLSSAPEISGPQVEPYNITAQQMSLEAAVKKIDERNTVATGYDPAMLVWFVTMEGVWYDEFPRPENFPTPTPYHHYAIIIDAKTGLDIESSASP